MENKLGIWTEIKHTISTLKKSKTTDGYSLNLFAIATGALIYASFSNDNPYFLLLYATNLYGMATFVFTIPFSLLDDANTSAAKWNEPDNRKKLIWAKFLIGNFHGFIGAILTIALFFYARYYVNLTYVLPGDPFPLVDKVIMLTYLLLTPFTAYAADIWVISRSFVGLKRTKRDLIRPRSLKQLMYYIGICIILNFIVPAGAIIVSYTDVYQGKIISPFLFQHATYLLLMIFVFSVVIPIYYYIDGSKRMREQKIFFVDQ